MGFAASPDLGKTVLTENLLAADAAVYMAGKVKAGGESRRLLAVMTNFRIQLADSANSKGRVDYKPDNPTPPQSASF